jgi:hypothetical protein
MQIPSSSSPESLPMAGASLEAIYLSHMLETLRELRFTFKDQKDVETFSLYIEYLKAVTLGDVIQSQMDKEVDKLKLKMTKEKPVPSQTIQTFRCGFLVVKEVMKYLNASLDLTHEDIMGEAYNIDRLSEKQVTLDKVLEDSPDVADSPV